MSVLSGCIMEKGFRNIDYTFSSMKILHTQKNRRDSEICLQQGRHYKEAMDKTLKIYTMQTISVQIVN